MWWATNRVMKVVGMYIKPSNHLIPKTSSINKYIRKKRAGTPIINATAKKIFFVAFIMAECNASNMQG